MNFNRILAKAETLQEMQERTAAKAVSRRNACSFGLRGYELPSDDAPRLGELINRKIEINAIACGHHRDAFFDGNQITGVRSVKGDV